MKKFGLLLLTMCLSAFVLSAQAPTRLHVTLLNNHFQKVDLTNAYGSSMTSYASADIAEDQFKMIVTLPNDIYKLDFGNGSTMLLVIVPGENVEMTLDAENLQQIVSVSGSETMTHVKEMAYLAGVYEEARQALGITDSYQGRRDATAQSGVAKQFAAQQSAGRLESKRVMKAAAYAELFKRIVMLKVAYADEPRPIVAEDDRGQAKYEEFNRYDFYEQDEGGAWHCILDEDRFLFSCDTSAPLANDREQMWQEASRMFQLGAFGNPQEEDTRILFWSKLEQLHYPGASDTKEYLEKRKQEAEASGE